MTYRRRREPRDGGVPPCQVCHGEGLLELAPLPDGRWACVTCRYDKGIKTAAAETTEPENRGNKRQN